jgi:V/A-type H+/Na+-transporting ATPase subunit I
MIRPRKMRRVELTILERDIDMVLEYLGKQALIHLSFSGQDETALIDIDPQELEAQEKSDQTLSALQEAAAALDIPLPDQPGPLSKPISESDREQLSSILAQVQSLLDTEKKLHADEQKTRESLEEARSFAALQAPFAELDSLSYMTLRVGRMDERARENVLKALGDRAVIMSLGEGDKVLAASSRKGRFALDTELERSGFVPLAVPENFKGVPEDILQALHERLDSLEEKIQALGPAKEELRTLCILPIQRIYESLLTRSIMDSIKNRMERTTSTGRLSGWVPLAELKSLCEDLERLSEGRIGIRVYEPSEISSVIKGKEKVPVSLQHGAFVKGFEQLVFSYGAPLYGSIDPTPFVAVSFAILFGLMFGDVGQGAVLLLLGMLIRKGKPRFLAGFRRFGIPMIAVGISSMLVGLLDGEVFSNEHLLIRPTRAITGFLTGVPVDRVLSLMPERGSMDKLLVFFAFTLSLGVLINSIGMIINIVNLWVRGLKERVFFSRTGIAGLSLFWYAIFMAVRIALGSSFSFIDAIGLGLPIFAIFFGPALWRLFTGTRPVFEDGIVTFVVEGIVDLLETASSFTSNTVSFLRVGAFALSHAVLSFIVFSLSTMVQASSAAGPVLAFFVMLIGNAVIILLEGLIVAIQVVRLQYYEFFSKFFTETGELYKPFRFRKEEER